MRSKYHSKLMDFYEKIRDEEESALKRRKEEITEVLPKVLELENKIARTSVEIAMLHVRNPEDWEVKLKELKSKVLDLRGEKAELLVANGFPLDYLDLKYRCRKCKDTGFIGLDKCTCYNKNMATLIYEESEFSKLLDEYSFEEFDLELFNDKLEIPGTGKTIRENMNENFNLARIYVENFPNHNENLFFFGTSGTGKTFLATCIARELLKKGYVVVYRTAAQLIEDIKEIRFKENDDVLDMLMNTDLLIIDDLGTEFKSELSRTEIFNIINGRLLDKKKMIISTNLIPEELGFKYSERLLSRIVGDFMNIKFGGVDLRFDKGRLKRRNFYKKFLQEFE